MSDQKPTIAEGVTQDLGTSAAVLFDRAQVAKAQCAETRAYVAQLVLDNSAEVDPWAHLFQECVSVAVLISDVRVPVAQLKELVGRVSQAGSGVLVFMKASGQGLEPKAGDQA